MIVEDENPWNFSHVCSDVFILCIYGNIYRYILLPQAWWWSTLWPGAGADFAYSGLPVIIRGTLACSDLIPTLRTTLSSRMLTLHADCALGSIHPTWSSHQCRVYVCKWMWEKSLWKKVCQAETAVLQIGVGCCTMRGFCDRLQCHIYSIKMGGKKPSSSPYFISRVYCGDVKGRVEIALWRECSDILQLCAQWVS